MFDIIHTAQFSKASYKPQISAKQIIKNKKILDYKTYKAFKLSLNSLSSR